MKKTVLVTTNWDSGTYNELYEQKSKRKGGTLEPIIQEGHKVRRFRPILAKSGICLEYHQYPPPQMYRFSGPSSVTKTIGR